MAEFYFPYRIIAVCVLLSLFNGWIRHTYVIVLFYNSHLCFNNRDHTKTFILLFRLYCI